MTEATKKAEADREQALAAENAKYATQVKALEQTAASAEKALAEAKSEHATQVASIEQAAAAAKCRFHACWGGGKGIY